MEVTAGAATECGGDGGRVASTKCEQILKVHNQKAFPSISKGKEVWTIDAPQWSSSRW